MINVLAIRKVEYTHTHTHTHTHTEILITELIRWKVSALCLNFISEMGIKAP